MKYAFNTINPIKKESKKLKKSLSAFEQFQNNNLQFFQDVVARFYGWTHFNELSFHQEKLNSLGNEKSLVSELKQHNPKDNINNFTKDSFRLVSSLSKSEQLSLVENKKKILKEIFVSKNVVAQEDVDSVIEHLFKDNSVLTLFTNLIKDKNKISSANNIPKNVLKDIFLLGGNSTSKKSKLFFDFFIPKSINRGGFFIVNESTFKSVVNDAISAYGISNTPYLFLDYRAEKEHSTLSTGVFDNYCLTTVNDLSEVSNMVAGYLNVNDKDDSDSSKLKYDAMVFFTEFINFQIRNNHQSKSLFDIWSEFSDLDKCARNSKAFMDNLVLKPLYSSPSYKKDNLYKAVAEMPFFSESYFTNNKEQSEMFYDDFSCMFLIVINTLRAMNIGRTSESKSINHILDSNGVVFVVISDKNKEFMNLKARAVLNAFRNNRIKELGVYIEATINKKIARDPFRSDIYPVFLQSYDYYPIAGLSVVSAQLRSTNTTTWICISEDFKYRAENNFMSDLERDSLIANSNNFAYAGDKISANFSVLVSERISNFSSSIISTLMESQSQKSLADSSKSIERLSSVDPIKHMKDSLNRNEIPLITRFACNNSHFHKI